MAASGFLRHFLPRRSGVAGGLALLALIAVPVSADSGGFTASYTISIAGLTIGRADVESRFNSSGYSLAINGFTSGISRLVSDATANLASRGFITGSHVYPASYSLNTTESGQSTSVRMRMSGGAITAVTAVPEPGNIVGRVPIRTRDKQNVVDPSSALILPAPHVKTISGEEACKRTVRVFDGWQRFDVRLSYKSTREISGGEGAYSGPVFVCGARYVPLAGHMPDKDSVKYMANNERIEIWLAPIADMSLLVPYSIQIGTQIGTLTVRATRLNFGSGAQRAAAE